MNFFGWPGRSLLLTLKSSFLNRRNKNQQLEYNEPDHHKILQEFNELQHLILSNQITKEVNVENAILRVQFLACVYNMNKSLKLEERPNCQLQNFYKGHTHELIFLSIYVTDQD